MEIKQNVLYGTEGTKLVEADNGTDPLRNGGKQTKLKVHFKNQRRCALTKLKLLGLKFENPSIGSRVMWMQHYDMHTYIHTYSLSGTE